MSSTTIEVAKYIHDLLYEYSSVIVPDLGAFSTRNKPATINEENQTISPPAKTVVFNERLKVNDGILVGHISKMESIPPSLVEDALKKFAAETKATLQTGEAVSLGNLGTLQYQTEKGIEFYPTSDLNLSLNSFGFQTLELPTIAATTPPSSNDNIGAAGIGGTSDMDFSFDEEKELPNEEEIPNTPIEKRTVSSVLAENAENLPPVIPPEQRRRSGGGWFWLLPLLILGLCFLLVMQLSKGDKEDGMTTNDTQTEENSGLWSIPPFSWFAGGDDKDEQLVDNTNIDSGNTTEEQEENTTTDESNTTESGNASTLDGDIETVDTDENTASNDKVEDTSSKNTTETNTKTTENSNDTKGDNSATDNGSDSNTNTSTTDNNSDSTTEEDNSIDSASGSENVTLTNTSALNSVNVTEAKNNEYVASNAPKGYYIIVGAFKSQSNANKAISNLKTKGYEAHALQSTSGYYRVGIYGSADGKTAKERYDSARANENAKAWMLSLQ
ncbi:MAG: SPOR domain-containing protein [Chitinophagales bacterium]